MSDLLKQALDSGVIPKKSLGQHFLINRGIIDKIVKAAGDLKEHVVLEVGPGIGSLTAELVTRAKMVIAVEKDVSLVDFLKQAFSEADNILIVPGDALAVDVSALKPLPTMLIANLPYNIANTLIVHYLALFPFLEKYIVMVQKEAARRLTAAPASKNYSGLSVKVQSVAEVKYLFEVKPGSFFPPPEVHSAVISLNRKKVEIDLNSYFRFIDVCFAHRRKKLANNLVAGGLFETRTQAEKFLNKTGIDENARPQEITPEKYIEMFHALLSE